MTGVHKLQMATERCGTGVGLLRQLDPDLMRGSPSGLIVALPVIIPAGPIILQPPLTSTAVEWKIQQPITRTGFDMGCGIREVRRVPRELRGARVPVRYKVTRNASGQDGRLDPVVVHREVHHAVVIAGVAIEPNLGDVRGGQSEVRAGPDVREPLRRRRRSRALHQIWVGARLVIVRRHQEPAVLAHVSGTLNPLRLL